MKFTVAIDGPAAAGKGTLSKRVAAEFGFAHLDTGLLYRATGARVLDGADPVSAAQNLTPEDLARDDLRTTAVAQAASKAAAIPQVRAALVQFQHDFAGREGGAVLDGRDIGTVICPDAQVKLFVTASDTVRAERRYLELSGKGQDVTREGVFRDLTERDARDREREAAPLAAAQDAVVIDTSHMTIEDAVAAAVAAIRTAL
ncbi:(d)CMP kinase [uncultured Litoreibacter sp.]|uniref:(d)CMP kinase n=1 Tax=uncultured Litoreibacter sp. TaxID=1392394 RepID=UPI00260F9492|nr:(d)CMP kinase [uncultured Litoreibacter sp.]